MSGEAFNRLYSQCYKKTATAAVQNACMKVSARNVFRGVIHALDPGRVSAEVRVELAGGAWLTAVVTTQACRELGLVPGGPVVALVKASGVMLMAGANTGGAGLPGCSSLPGQVKSVRAGAVHAEVTLALAGGTELTAVVTADAVRELALAPGAAATALVPASRVVLGVPDDAA